MAFQTGRRDGYESALDQHFKSLLTDKQLVVRLVVLARRVMSVTTAFSIVTSQDDKCGQTPCFACIA